MLWRSRYRNMDIELGEGLRSHDTALYIYCSGRSLQV
jgi:hypothetical protein